MKELELAKETLSKTAHRLVRWEGYLASGLLEIFVHGRETLAGSLGKDMVTTAARYIKHQAANAAWAARVGYGYEDVAEAAEALAAEADALLSAGRDAIASDPSRLGGLVLALRSLVYKLHKLGLADDELLKR